MYCIRRAVEADIEGIARVHVDTWRTAYTGIMPAERLANLSYERSSGQWLHSIRSGRGFIDVAEEAGEIVGFASSGAERNHVTGYDSEVYALYVLAAYQGQGIGRELVRSAAKELWDRGYQTMLIWVLEDNTSARHFYEKMGGVLIEDKLYYPLGGDTHLVEVGYGYQISELIGDKIP
ncbi:GNAT family N-acetyltransferase [Phototrophicus methaneseepsis]|uniref:GNAT family N-acetyltransferase n=1 Tax=Phototrophicus methaneseepsis TaxID=2710758 RepID=A0A7S8IGU9_9CHLR|nr:GNAT family N-acetyltransferase [Phototrophicus methaneseepsis]QPC85077.1 GNAT family N-acetyltransferase [Phototrophicus methaneseepsis]